MKACSAVARGVFAAGYLITVSLIPCQLLALDEDTMWLCGTDSTHLDGLRGCPGTISADSSRKALIIFIKFDDDTIDWYDEGSDPYPC